MTNFIPTYQQKEVPFAGLVRSVRDVFFFLQDFKNLFLFIFYLYMYRGCSAPCSLCLCNPDGKREVVIQFCSMQ